MRHYIVQPEKSIDRCSRKRSHEAEASGDPSRKQSSKTLSSHFACSKPVIATYLLIGGLFYVRMTHAVPRSGADDLSCDHVPHTWYTETALFVDQHSKLIMRDAVGPTLAHEVHSADRPASGPCHGTRPACTTGRAIDQLGRVGCAWDRTRPWGVVRKVKVVHNGQSLMRAHSRSCLSITSGTAARFQITGYLIEVDYRTQVTNRRTYFVGCIERPISFGLLWL